MTTVCACEKTVVMVKQPGHLTSMKKERGAGTSVCFFLVSVGVGLGLGVFFGERGGGTLSLCLRDSAAGVGFRRSMARTWWLVKC